MVHCRDLCFKAIILFISSFIDRLLDVVQENVVSVSKLHFVDLAGSGQGESKETKHKAFLVSLLSPCPDPTRSTKCKLILKLTIRDN